MLALALSVDPATISRDIKYLRELRVRLMKDHRVNEDFADRLMDCLTRARIHPREEFVWQYLYKKGVESFTVRRVTAAMRRYYLRKQLRPKQIRKNQLLISVRFR